MPLLPAGVVRGTEEPGKWESQLYMLEGTVPPIYVLHIYCNDHDADMQQNTSRVVCYTQKLLTSSPFHHLIHALKTRAVLVIAHK
jgi:hypothetical protein